MPEARTSSESTLFLNKGSFSKAIILEYYIRHAAVRQYELKGSKHGAFERFL